MKIKEVRKLRKRIPEFKANCGDCNECCHSPIMMTKSELQQIEKIFGIHPRHDDKTLCPFYNKEKHRCDVYSERLIICRMFGIEEGFLACSHHPEQAIYKRHTFRIPEKYFFASRLPKVIAEHFPIDEIEKKLGRKITEFKTI